MMTIAMRKMIFLVVAGMVGGTIWLGEVQGAGPSRQWVALDKDGLHDPQGPDIKTLQQPAEALSALPSDTAGNQVLWAEALRQGLIQPRTNIQPETKVNLLELDLIYGNTGDSPFVRFPHRTHTEWLDCTNCHEQLFKSKFGASSIKMMAILQGESCGQCHGAVAFPLTECNRCHSVDPNKFKGKFGPQPVAVTGGKP